MTIPTMYLSRARLRRDVPGAALRAILAPDGVSERAATTHRMVWTLFSDSQDRERDFLWRETQPGSFYCLSSRPPEDKHGLFSIDPPKEFVPVLKTGDKLSFMLRVNATVAKSMKSESGDGKRLRGKPCDIVMDALKYIPKSERAEARHRLLEPVAHGWLSRQGEKHGFSLEKLPHQSDPDDLDRTNHCFRVREHRVLQIERGQNRPSLRLGVLDLEGLLEVRDPSVFLSAITHGFGRAKAFGCGLMLIRRA